MARSPPRSSPPFAFLNHGLAGIAVGLGFATILWLVDLGGIRTMLMRSATWVDNVVYVVGAVTTICPLVLATAIGLVTDGDSQSTMGSGDDVSVTGFGVPHRATIGARTK